MVFLGLEELARMHAVLFPLLYYAFATGLLVLAYALWY